VDPEIKTEVIVPVPTKVVEFTGSVPKWVPLIVASTDRPMASAVNAIELPSAAST